MSETVLLILVGVLALTSITMTVMYFRKPKSHITNHGTIERIQEMGELTALSMVFKNISTIKEDDIKFLYGGKKLLIITEHEIEYRYNLRSAKITKKDDSIHVVMPPCIPKTAAKKMPETYHEEKGTVLGLLKLFDITPEDRNELTKQADKSAAEKAAEKTQELIPHIEHSAANTLKNLFLSAGIEDVTISFSDENSVVRMVKEDIEANKAA